MNIIEISNKFPSELDAIKHFENARWDKKPKCAYCDSKQTGKRNKDYRFHCQNCDKTFSVTTNTYIHNTRLPLKTWLYAFGIISDAKKGISAKQLERNLGIHYETAWNMYMKIRDLMDIENQDIQLDEIVELDDTMTGGKPRKRPKMLLTPKQKEKLDKQILEYGKEYEITTVTKYKKKYPKTKPKRGRGADRPKIAGLVERNGNVIAEVMQTLSYAEIRQLVEKYVKKDDSVIISDDYKSYKKLSEIIDNITIDHKTMYAYKGLHTNTIESFWAIIKRGLIGQFHHVSEKYLPDYVAEFVFKYNNRNEDDMFETLVKNSMLDKN